MFFSDKNACTVLNTAFQMFSVIPKNRCHLRHHTFQESQKYLYSGENVKKNFLQLRCSNVLLHLKYSVLLCEPNIEFNNLAWGKALATDHRVRLYSARVYANIWPKNTYIRDINGVYPAVILKRMANLNYVKTAK